MRLGAQTLLCPYNYLYLTNLQSAVCGESLAQLIDNATHVNS